MFCWRPDRPGGEITSGIVDFFSLDKNGLVTDI